MVTNQPSENRASARKATDDKYLEYLYAVGLADLRSGFEIQNRIGSLLRTFTIEDSANSRIRWEAGKADGFSRDPLRTGMRFCRSDGHVYAIVKTYGDNDTAISYTIKHEKTGKEYYRCRQGLEQAINQDKIALI
jgi:hypothetical protein